MRSSFVLLLLLPGLVFAQQPPQPCQDMPNCGVDVWQCNFNTAADRWECIVNIGELRNCRIDSTGDIVCHAPGAGTPPSGPDTADPVIFINGPLVRTVNTPTLGLAGTADDNVGVTYLEWYNSTHNIPMPDPVPPPASPFAFTVDLRPGTQSIEIIARDAAGNEAIETLTVTYDDSSNPPPPPPPPPPDPGPPVVGVVTVMCMDADTSQRYSCGQLDLSRMKITPPAPGAQFTLQAFLSDTDLSVQP